MSGANLLMVYTRLDSTYFGWKLSMQIIEKIPFSNFSWLILSWWRHHKLQSNFQLFLWPHIFQSAMCLYLKQDKSDFVYYKIKIVLLFVILCMQCISWNLLYGYSLINPCDKDEDCVGPYGYKHAMTLSANTAQFAVS